MKYDSEKDFLTVIKFLLKIARRIKWQLWDRDLLPLIPSFFLLGKTRYIKMQKLFYNYRASKSVYDQNQKIDAVVGSYEEHNEWEDYDNYLMSYVDESYKKKVALDFACGPGRNIIKYRDRFLRIDGLDISEVNIKNAIENLHFFGMETPNLYVTSGNDCGSRRRFKL